MFLIRRLISIILIFSIFVVSSFCVLSFSANAENELKGRITGSDVRVRTGPSTTNTTIIEKLSYTVVTVLEKVNSNNEIWYKVTYHNGTEQITGYVSGQYVEIITYNPDADFETKLKAFPESYRDALRELHAIYPNWEFIPDAVALTFKNAVALQSVDMRKQVQFNSSTQSVSWRSMGPGSYDWDDGKWITTNGGWTGASREVIAYYMDPRNFLNATEIYQFLQQGYDSSVQTEAGVKQIIKGTFMENNYNDPDDTTYGGSYVKVLMEAARQSGVSPYILASKIRQEIGVAGTSQLVSGTTSYGKYYNFFNIGASGSTSAEVVANGLSRAKSEGWTTRSKSIIGGAKFLSNNYISSGQDTYFYQNFNVHQPDRLWHQYAQAVHDARSKGVSLAKSYGEQTDFALSFRIPVYSEMPDSVSPKPASNSNKNNYYFDSMSISGLTPSFSKFTYEYDLHMTGDNTIYLKPVSGASYVGQASYNIKKGNNTIVLKAKAETGYTNDYVIRVSSTVDCKLNISTTSQPANTVKRGDTNGDGKITLSDLANIRLHLLGLFTISGNNVQGADTNGDGKITLSDLANIRLHLLGLYTIS